LHDWNATHWNAILYVYACHPRGALPAPGLAGCPAGRGE